MFKEELLPHFLTVLLQSLVDRNHGLLQDEVVGALFSMASVDFELFYLRFIPGFLAANTTLDDSQKQTLVSNLKPESVRIYNIFFIIENGPSNVFFAQFLHFVLQDLPSFSQGTLRLVNDLHCYQLCNASLPEGSIRL